jgi:hypothetical protein
MYREALVTAKLMDNTIKAGKFCIELKDFHLL